MDGYVGWLEAQGYSRGVIQKVSLWLGHASVQTTEIYTRADPTEKLEAISAMISPQLRKGSFRPPDKFMDLLKAVTLCGANKPVNATVP